MIYCSASYSNITIRNCTFSEFGHTAIWLQHGDNSYITNVTIEDCVIEDAVYSGIMVIGVDGGTIQRNTVRRIGYAADGYDSLNCNCYGISVTNDGDGSYPSTDVLVADNVVEDIPLWHGLSTHGGRGLTFRHNTVRRCARAMFVTGGPNASHPQDCIIESNLFTHPKDDRPTRNGTDDGIAMTECAGINNIFRNNHIGDSAVETGHPYANIYYDTCEPSTNTTLTNNTRSETLPTYPEA